MKKAMLAVLFFSISLICKADVETAQEAGTRLAYELNAEIDGGDLRSKKIALSRKTDLAISSLISLGVHHLEERGFRDHAFFIKMEYATEFSGFVERYVSEDRAIGDHAPLIEFLDKAYKLFYEKLGFQICKTLRLTDIYTFNHTIPVVFKPCTFPMDSVTDSRIQEYENHFVGSADSLGDYYNGLAPVTTFWVAELTCTAATWGGGAFFVCGPLSMAAEWAMWKMISPWLSKKIFTAACG